MRRGRHHVGHGKQRVPGFYFEDGAQFQACGDELRTETRPGAVEELASVAAPAGFGPSGQRDLDLVAVTRERSDVHLILAGLVGHEREPASVR